ncbi:unnamed protein product (macronuclear) [Paramecium tetraurelia]|uniref:Tubulin-tyrosine ligase family protein n=1 Tax=Paramecium tetraurelia TaxID=5888 RepID=A0EFG8_PARTE|nr:uncharacterized protein GSPATT00026382001 [Paramecium tetraurelia]CAK94059.1 unnamed protein product [Paramecium tetraurelia]|eukprot:XP_001461432.1 hypothetical protein (macronuclear) [Paramecium tetraurelia strain d4-2]
MQKDETYIRTPPIRKLNNGLAIQQKINQLNKQGSIKFSELTKEQPSNQKISYRRQSQPRKPVSASSSLTLAISMQRNLSQEPQTNGTYSVVFANSAPQKRDKRKVQTTNCDQIEEFKNSQVRLVKGFYPSDINNTKLILTNILQGMQQRISAEKTFGVMGLQVVPFNKIMESNTSTVLTQQTIRLKALSHDKDREKSQSFTEEVEKKTKCKIPQKCKLKHSINSNNASPVPPKVIAPQSSSTQINNFKFSLTDYASLSREQLFQTKLQNYQHFLFLVSTQSGFYTVPQDCLIDLKFKIGRGNNSLLIKEIFKLRWWWNCYKYSELIDSESNFIWTQIKVQNYMDTQNLSTNEIKSYMRKKINPPQSQTQIKKKIQIDHLLRLMNDDSDYKQIERNQKAYFKLINQKGFTILNVHPNLKIHNHIEKNYHLGNKKALYHNLKRYYELTKQDLHSIIPMTFHVQKGSKDKVYLQFLENYKKLPKGSTWIVKPGEFTNRGTGIIVCQNLSEINKIISKKQVHPNGKPFTYLIQRYIEKPFLYNKRKFDIRCYFLITQLNNIFRAYWYEDGYIRTSSEEFDLDDPANLYVHLTNDAIQKYADTYGKYENGNKLSLSEFQRYLENQSKKYNFYKDLYPQLIEIATISIKSVYCKLAPHKKEFNFEIFGLDFMIDSQFKPYLIEINTNPCLETSSPILQRIIPQMVENAMRLSIDTIIPPPDASVWPPCKKHLIFYDNLLENNKFQLIFDEREDSEELIKLYGGLLQHDEIDEMDEEEEEYQSDDENEKNEQ